MLELHKKLPSARTDQEKTAIQSQITDLNLDGVYADYPQILDGTLASDYRAMVVDAGDTNAGFGKWETRFAPWSARLGLKFSF